MEWGMAWVRGGHGWLGGWVAPRGVRALQRGCQDGRRSGGEVVRCLSFVFVIPCCALQSAIHALIAREGHTAACKVALWVRLQACVEHGFAGSWSVEAKRPAGAACFLSSSGPLRLSDQSPSRRCTGVRSTSRVSVRIPLYHSPLLLLLSSRAIAFFHPHAPSFLSLSLSTSSLLARSAKRASSPSPHPSVPTTRWVTPNLAASLLRVQY